MVGGVSVDTATATDTTLCWSLSNLEFATENKTIRSQRDDAQ